MKNIIKHIMLLSFFAMNIHPCLPAKPDELPSEVKNTLDRHVRELRSMLGGWNDNQDDKGGANVTEFEDLPGYVIKHGICRVGNAKRLEAFIAKHTLLHTGVAKKYIYYLPGSHNKPSNQYCCVVAEKIEGIHGDKEGASINLEQAKQLCTIALNAPHYDLHGANYVITNDGKITIVDTDNVAMPSFFDVLRRRIHWFFYGSASVSRGRLRLSNDPLTDLDVHRKFTPEAADFLQATINKRETIRKLTKLALVVGSAATLGYMIYVKYFRHSK